MDRIHAEERRRSRSEWIRALFRRAFEADRKRRARVAKTITVLAAWLPHGTCQTAPQTPIIPMPVEEVGSMQDDKLSIHKLEERVTELESQRLPERTGEPRQDKPDIQIVIGLNE